MAGFVLCAGCGELFPTDSRPPPAPDGFPQPARLEHAKAELQIDGERYVTEYATGITYNEEGGFADQLRGRLSLDALGLEFRDLEPGVVDVESGDLTATWSGVWIADARCGQGRLEIMGLRTYDSGVRGDRDFVWGTVQFELCEDDYADDFGLARTEVTGRFTSLVDYR